MANVFSTVFANKVATGTNPDVLYTVPAGSVAVVKSINLFANFAPMTRNLQCNIATGTSGAILFRVGDPYCIAQRCYTWWGMHVVPSGQTIRSSNAIAGWHIAISGYLLTLP